MTKKNSITALLFSTVGIGLMFLIAVAVCAIFSAVKFRIDFTQEKLYTLSRGTKAILSKLEAPTEIRFYCTQSANTMPVQLKTYATHVEDLLDEYRKYSGGKLTLKKLDPTPDSDAEDSATLDGVEGQMTPSGEKIYLGLAVSSLGTKVAIPFLSPDRERLLEYDLSRTVAGVASPAKPVIGVMSTLPVFGEMNPMMMQMGQARRENPWVFLSELQRDFEVKQVEPTADKIDDNIQVLLVAHPKDVTEATQFALDQFVLRGGKLLAFLDPLSVVDSRSSSMNPLQRAQSNSSNLETLLKAWGISFDSTKVVADMNFVTRINRGAQPESSPAVLSMTREGLDTNDVTTSQIDSLLIPFAGVFSGTPVEGLKETVLLHTTRDSQVVDKMMAEFSGAQIAKDFAPSGKAQTLALRLTGKFKTAFPNGKPAEKTEDGSPPKPATPAEGEVLKASTKDGVVVLVGDADLLYDQFSVQIQEILGQRIVIPRNGNLTFVQNLVEQLAGDSNLIEVRGRATLSRPFTVVKRIQAQAEANYRSKIRDLEQSLSVTQQRLNDLQRQKKEAGQNFILSADQQEEIKRFREKERESKLELKQVRKNLRQDIDSLENRLKWVNIAGMPVLVTFAGIALALVKRKKTAAK